MVIANAFWLPASYYSGYQSIAKDTPALVDQVSYDTGAWALSEGIDRTQKREAENLQLIAAANPQGRFYANDFNPAHIVFARDLAREARLDNVTFLENFFDELRRRVPTGGK